jgi:hypothetical protein
MAGALACLAVFSARAEAPAATPAAGATGSVLEFVDGSALHGQLERMDLEHGVSWLHPEARSAIHFKPAHIDCIRFARAENVTMAPTCHLFFANGDDIFGSVSNLDGGQLSLNTWFGGTLSVPRGAVSAIAFLPRGYRIVYEGPYDAGGWYVGNNADQGWTYQDGGFVGAGAGTLGRDLGLTNSMTVEFDVAWTGQYSLLVSLYCDPREFAGNSFLLESTQISFDPNTVRLVNAAGAAAAALPAGLDQNKMRVTIHCNKEEGTLEVFVNDLLVKSWEAGNSYKGAGTGILFRRVSMPGTTVRLSNFSMAAWSGRYGPDASLTATNGDFIHFINHDRTGGKITGIKDGKVTVSVGGSTLAVPLERVTQISLGGAGVPAEPSGPWEVRAHFPGGGSLSFQLEKWDEHGLSGKSAIFGPLEFQTGAIRRMDFNLHRPKADLAGAGGREFGDLDE